MDKDIFRERVNILPLEYPDLMKYVDAINHSYWLHTEWNFVSDVQDFKVELDDYNRDIIVKTVISISQVEVMVKRFWGNLHDLLPVPEIDDIGGTHSDSEVRHKRAYATILEKLQLQDLFKASNDFPVIANRRKYLSKVGLSPVLTKEDIALKIILFSILIEHVSLFGQFYILMSYNKRWNIMKDISNVVEATSKEEDTHGNTGIKIYSIILRENPTLDKEYIDQRIIELCKEAWEAESSLIDWIFEGEAEDKNCPLRSEEVKNFVADRLNKSLNTVGIKGFSFIVDAKLLDNTKWFYEELTLPKEMDHFNKKSTDYNKKSKSITANDIFTD